MNSISSTMRKMYTKKYKKYKKVASCIYAQDLAWKIWKSSPETTLIFHLEEEMHFCDDECLEKRSFGVSWGQHRVKREVKDDSSFNQLTHHCCCPKRENERMSSSTWYQHCINVSSSASFISLSVINVKGTIMTSKDTCLHWLQSCIYMKSNRISITRWVSERGEWMILDS